MVEKFLKYYELCHYQKQSLILTLEHNKTCGWFCQIFHEDSQTVVYENDDESLNIICAKGYIALEEWAREFNSLADIEMNL